jgi:hypothetical protein
MSSKGKLKLEEFGGNKIPLYAILSHVWGGNEVTFQDINSALRKKRWDMIRLEKLALWLQPTDSIMFGSTLAALIRQAAQSSLKQLTQCMYRWYHESGVCYAYLADVPPNAVDDEFARSRWFTRGWTLQELIAPSTVIFLDQKWQKISTKSSRQRIISEITGSPANILLGGDLERASVAQKMSWASKRETTRVEDIPYAILRRRTSIH